MTWLRVFSQFKADLGLDPRSALQLILLRQDSTESSNLWRVFSLHLHLPGTYSFSTSFPALSCPSSKQGAQLAEFLPGPGPCLPPSSHAISTLSTCSGKAEVQAVNPGGLCSSLVRRRRRKVVYLLATRTERWERSGTSPLGSDPHSLTSLCLRISFLGHFMGKKSLAIPSPLGTAPHISLRDQRLQLSHDLLRILLLKKALGLSLDSPASHTQVSQAPTLGPGQAQPGLPLDPALGLGCNCPTRA